MLVISPAPRSSWTPRAEPCTIFGAGDSVPDSYLVYQKGWIKSRIDVQLLSDSLKMTSAG